MNELGNRSTVHRFGRLAAYLLAIVALLPIEACGSDVSGSELTSSPNGVGYTSPVWVGDSIYYIAYNAEDFSDSDTTTALMRVRDGGLPELIAVHRPECRSPDDVDPSARALVAMGDHEIGLLVYCSWDSSDPNRTALIRQDVDNGSAADVATFSYGGYGVAWVNGTGTAYARERVCTSGSVRVLSDPAATCFDATDVREPVATPGGQIVYFASRCGTDAAGAAGNYVICRHDGPGRETVLARGVRNPAGLAVHENRVAVAAEIDGRDGLWLLDAGKVRNVAHGEYRGVAFASDGARLAAPLRDEGWFSTHWSIRVIATPTL